MRHTFRMKPLIDYSKCSASVRSPNGCPAPVHVIVTNDRNSIRGLCRKHTRYSDYHAWRQISEEEAAILSVHFE